MNLKAIGFDLDDTLYSRNDIYEMVFDTMEKEVVETNIDFNEFNEIFEQHSQNEYELFMEGKQDRKTYRVQRVIKAYQHFGYEITEADAVKFQEFYVENQAHLKFQEGALELIEMLLEKGITIFLLTNGPSTGQRKKIETLEISNWFPGDMIFISDELNLTKPDIEIFEYIEEKLNVKSEEILYIGDDFYNDILGANKAKWHSIYFNKHPEDYTNLSNVSHAETFKEVKEILEKSYKI